MNTELTTGTTLEILAPYLPYGIDLQSDRGVRRRLASLFYGDRAHVHKMDEVDAEKIHLGNLSVEIKYWLPVLHSFADLCAPLPDGTVPAVEAINLEVRFGQKVKSAKLINHERMGCLILAYADPSKQYEYLLEPTLFTEGRFSLKAATYLRRHHFAVGLLPHQFIEKQA